MNTLYYDHWEFNCYAETYRKFVESYDLQDCFYEVFKDKIQEVTDKKITKGNMFKHFNVLLENNGYNEFDILELLADHYIKKNDLFDVIRFTYSSGDGLYQVYFLTVKPDSQKDLKRYMTKHLDAYKEGWGDIIDAGIERKLKGGAV
jgi:hypothetical protein